LAIGALAGLSAGAFGLFMVHRAGHDEELPEDADADALALHLTSRRPA
jgi:hypothetical protein